MVTLNSPITAWIRHFLDCMGGCFGCCTKPTPIIAVDEPSKGLKIQGRTVEKPSISDGFWSTSTCDLDNNSAIQSQRSVSSISISTSNLTLNQCSGANSHSDFVNHGLHLWNQGRVQWIGSSKPSNKTQQSWEPHSRCVINLLVLYGIFSVSIDSSYFHPPKEFHCLFLPIRIIACF